MTYERPTFNAVELDALTAGCCWRVPGGFVFQGTCNLGPAQEAAQTVLGVVNSL